MVRDVWGRTGTVVREGHIDDTVGKVPDVDADHGEDRGNVGGVGRNVTRVVTRVGPDPDNPSLKSNTGESSTASPVPPVLVPPVSEPRGATPRVVVIRVTRSLTLPSRDPVPT